MTVPACADHAQPPFSSLGAQPPTPFSITLRVYWEDTDAGGVVFYANHLKYFERARTEWLRALGLEQQALKDNERTLFVVSQADVRYHAPARLDDLLRVDVRVAERGRASLLLDQRSHRVADGLLISTARVRIGCVDADHWRARRLPDSLQAALDAEARNLLNA